MAAMMADATGKNAAAHDKKEDVFLFHCNYLNSQYKITGRDAIIPG